MVQFATEAGETNVFLAPETLVLLGVIFGGLALILSAVALGLVLAHQGRRQSVRGRRTLIKPGS